MLADQHINARPHPDRIRHNLVSFVPLFPRYHFRHAKITNQITPIAPPSGVLSAKLRAAS